MNIEDMLSQFCWQEPSRRTRMVEELSPDELFNLAQKAVQDVTVPGAREFADAVILSRGDIGEETLLTLVSSSGLYPNPDVLTHRHDLTEKVALTIAVHTLMNMVRGTEMGTFTIFSHPKLPSWVMGVAYQLAKSKRFAGTIAGGTFASYLAKNQSFPLLAKAKLHPPEQATAMVGIWVGKQDGRLALLPHLDLQVRDQFPDLADLPVHLLLDVLHVQPLPTGFWDDVPKLYEPLVAAFILVDDEEEEDETW